MTRDQKLFRSRSFQRVIAEVSLRNENETYTGQRVERNYLVN